MVDSTLIMLTLLFDGFAADCAMKCNDEYARKNPTRRY
jgi:hypothetical protein